MLKIKNFKNFEALQKWSIPILKEAKETLNKIPDVVAVVFVVKEFSISIF